MQDQLIDETINKFQTIQGIDIIYFLDKDFQLVKEQKNTDTSNYLEQIILILKSQALSEKIASTFYSNSFHTFTLLNEAGLIVISRINLSEELYMIIIAGEKEPVDLIKLLKICKEVRNKSPEKQTTV